MSKPDTNTVDVDEIIVKPEDDSQRGEEKATVSVKRLNSPRKGVKLAVIAVELLICDVLTTEQEIIGRPFLHTFLRSLYRNYDIILWSDRNMAELEDTVKLLGVKEHPNYKLLGYVANTMQPLQVIWSELPTYNCKNTIICDTRARTVWNTPNGIAVFPNVDERRNTDKDLLKLSSYMKGIAKCSNVSKLDHTKWRIRVYVSEERKCACTIL